MDVRKYYIYTIERAFTNVYVELHHAPPLRDGVILLLYLSIWSLRCRTLTWLLTPGCELNASTDAPAVMGFNDFSLSNLSLPLGKSAYKLLLFADAFCEIYSLKG